MTRLLARLHSDRRGAAMVEFGILAPAILTLLIGILQVGFWMQAYNALRSAAADTGRYVAVEYQKSNKITNIQMALWARSRTISGYQLTASNVSTEVVDATNQTIGGVTEKTLTINYTMPSFLGIAGIGEIPVSLSRPIFVKTG